MNDKKAKLLIFFIFSILYAPRDHHKSAQAVAQFLTTLAQASGLHKKSKPRLDKVGSHQAEEGSDHQSDEKNPGLQLPEDRVNLQALRAGECVMLPAGPASDLYEEVEKAYEYAMAASVSSQPSKDKISVQMPKQPIKASAAVCADSLLQNIKLLLKSTGFNEKLHDLVSRIDVKYRYLISFLAICVEVLKEEQKKSDKRIDRVKNRLIIKMISDIKTLLANIFTKLTYTNTGINDIRALIQMQNTFPQNVKFYKELLINTFGIDAKRLEINMGYVDIIVDISYILCFLLWKTNGLDKLLSKQLFDILINILDKFHNEHVINLSERISSLINEFQQEIEKFVEKPIPANQIQVETKMLRLIESFI